MRPGHWFTVPQEGDEDTHAEVLSRKRRGIEDDSEEGKAGVEDGEVEEEEESPHSHHHHHHMEVNNVTSKEDGMHTDHSMVEVISSIEIKSLWALESHSREGLQTAVVQIEARSGFNFLVTHSLFQFTNRAIFVTFVTGMVATITVSSCNFTNNEAIGPGGAIQLEQRNGRVNALIKDNLFQGNVANSLQSLPSDVVNQLGTTDTSKITGSGGAIAINLAAASAFGSKCVVQIENNVFLNNTAANYGGTLFLTQGVTATLKGNSFTVSPHGVFFSYNMVLGS